MDKKARRPLLLERIISWEVTMCLQILRKIITLGFELDSSIPGVKEIKRDTQS
jgi:hypothetical protein